MSEETMDRFVEEKINIERLFCTILVSKMIDENKDEVLPGTKSHDRKWWVAYLHNARIFAMLVSTNMTTASNSHIMTKDLFSGIEMKS